MSASTDATSSGIRDMTTPEDRVNFQRTFIPERQEEKVEK
jgi:hypothetical protein